MEVGCKLEARALDHVKGMGKITLVGERCVRWQQTALSSDEQLLSKLLFKGLYQSTDCALCQIEVTCSGRDGMVFHHSLERQQ